MANIPKDVIANASDEDIKTIQSELGKQETKPVAEPSPAKQTVEKALPEASSDTDTKTSDNEAKPVKEEPQKPASEGEKTPSTEATIKTRERHTSQSVPYERFKEVNDKLKKLEAELSQTRSSTPPQPSNELDEFGQPYPVDEDRISKVVSTKVKEVIEPVVKTLDKQIENAKLEKALQEHPNAKKYMGEIKAYADATNLVYDDIVKLVLAKHSAPVTKEQVDKAVSEAQKAELNGKSNSSASRKSSVKTDVKKLSDEELERLVDQM